MVGKLKDSAIDREWNATKFAWKQPVVFIPFIIALISGFAFIEFIQVADPECAKPIEQRNKNLDPHVCEKTWMQWGYLGLSIVNIIACQLAFSKRKKEYLNNRSRN